MRFFFVYPERHTPGGGHKQIRVLARNLRSVGCPSFLLRESEFDDNGFYGIDVPDAGFLGPAASDHLQPSDVLVLPEYRLRESLRALRGTGCRKAVYAQGGFIALRDRPRGGYGKNGIEFMIGVSPYIAALGYHYLGLPEERVFYVPYPVFRGPFREPLPPFAERRLSVCCMPRKLPKLIEAVRQRVKRSHPTVPWVEIDCLPEPEVAKQLGRCTIFFSTQDGEGFGLPAIEAMARGCVVTGFGGTGGFPHPYKTTSNGLWAKDRSIEHATRQLCIAIDLVREGGARLRKVQKDADQTVQRFTEEAARDALLGALAVVRVREYNRRVERDQRRLGIRGHLQAWRALCWASFLASSAGGQRGRV